MFTLRASVTILALVMANAQIKSILNAPLINKDCFIPEYEITRCYESKGFTREGKIA